MKQQRSVETQQKILQAAMDLLLKGDDTELRISDVCKLTGNTTTSIYAYFESRQGLIDEAYLELYRLISISLQETLVNNLKNSTSGHEFVQLVKANRDTGSEMVVKFRSVWMRVNGLAMARGDFNEKLKPVKKEFNTAASVEFAKYQATGVISKRFSSHELPALLSGMILIRGIAEETGVGLLDDDFYVMTKIFCDD